MTTSGSPVRLLRAQAEKIAATVKAASRGDLANDPGGKLAAALKRDTFKTGIVMDDKIITVEMPWALIRETSEAAIAEYILKQMRGGGGPVQ